MLSLSRLRARGNTRHRRVAPVRPSLLKFRQAPVEDAPCSSQWLSAGWRPEHPVDRGAADFERLGDVVYKGRAATIEATRVRELKASPPPPAVLALAIPFEVLTERGKLKPPRFIERDPCVGRARAATPLLAPDAPEARLTPDKGSSRWQTLARGTRPQHCAFPQHSPCEFLASTRG
jgi:hypothetical protein